MIESTYSGLPLVARCTLRTTRLARRLAGDLLDQQSDLRLGEPAQRQHSTFAGEFGEDHVGTGAGRVVAAVRPDHEQPALRQVAGEEVQQTQRVVVGGVQVVEDHDQSADRRRTRGAAS